MNRSRVTGDLASHGNIFVDIANDRVGIGSTIPTNKLDIRGVVESRSAINFHESNWTGETTKIQLQAGYLHIEGGSNGTVFRNISTGNCWYVTSAGHFTVSTDSTFDIGTNAARVRNIYADTLYGDGSNLTGIDAGTLKHSNNTKAQATAYGVEVTGTIDTDGLIVSGVSTTTGNITGTGDLILTDTTADSAAGPEFKLFRNSASPADADYIGQIKFAGENDNNEEIDYAKITGKILDASDGTEDGILEFAHIKAGSQTITGRWRSDSLQLLNDTNLSVDGTTTLNNSITLNSDDSSPARIDLYCEVSNAHYTRLQAPAHSTYSGNVTVTLPNVTGNLAVLANASNNRVVTATGTHGMTGESGLTYDGSTLAVTGTLNSTGIILTGNMSVASDTAKVFFGASNDLSIFHDGSHSYIDDTGTGNLYIQSNHVNIDSKNGEQFINCIQDGAVELYHNDSKKFETSTAGGTLTGVFTVTSNIRVSGEIDLGTTNGNKFMDVCLGDNYGFYLRSTSGEGSSHEPLMQINRNQGATLYWDANPKFATTSDGVDFGTAGANDILCISGQTLHRTGGNGCGFHFSSQVVLPTNAAGTTTDNHTSIGNSSHRFQNAHFMQLSVHDRVNTDLKPYSSSTYDLGSTTYRWQEIYAGGLIQNIFTTAATSTQAEFRNEHSVYGGGVRFKSNNSYGTVEIINYNATASASIYNSTGGWHWTGNWQTHGAVLPFQDSSHTLGTSSKRWSHIYGDAITLTGTAAIERANTLRYRDLRNVAPADETTNMMRFYFTSWGNSGNSSGYADGLHMRSYGDSSGGSDNLIVWYKNGFGMRQFQQTFGSSTDYSSYAQYFHGQDHAIPQQNNTFDLGSTSYRWRNVYTQDLQLSNEGKTNDVDGTWGDFTIQEGKSDLFLINNRSGKKYKFNLTEVS